MFIFLLSRHFFFYFTHTLFPPHFFSLSILPLFFFVQMEHKVKNFKEIEYAVSNIWNLTGSNIKSITFDIYNNKAKIVPSKYCNNYEVSLLKSDLVSSYCILTY